MKFSRSQIVLGLAASVSAFPAAVLEMAKNDPVIAARASDFTKLLAERQAGADAAQAVFEPIPTFNAKAQFVNVGPGSGYEWVAPGPKDLRGPCPGLNAFANHGFLPHNGYATIIQFIDATTKVVGMGPQLAAFLAVLGASIDGDGLSWSIHGTPPPGVGGPLAQQGHGISGSHNKYESDASPIRHDLYESGENYLPNADQFEQLIAANPGGFVTLDGLTTFRSQRFDAQIANNPYFFNGPFTGVLVQPAAYTFIFRFMANHSEAKPYGELSYSVVQDWFGITGTPGSYKANVGQERIPLNWYKRAVEYPYDNEYFVADVAAAAALHPKFLDVGGNTGKTNTFTGIDVKNFTGGVFNGQTLLEGNNFACFAYQFAAQVKPDLALGALTALTSALNPIIGALACPQLEAFDEALLEDFAGFKKSTSDGITK